MTLLRAQIALAALGELRSEERDAVAQLLAEVATTPGGGAFSADRGIIFSGRESVYGHIAAAGSYEPIRLSLPWLLSSSAPRALAESVRLRMQRALGTDEVQYQDVTLPPYALRVGAPYQDDAFFTDFAIEDASLLVDWFGLDSTTHVLDVGCGQCRLAIGIMDRLGTVGRYVGLDLDVDSIDWGTRHLTSLDPAFEFELLRVGNARYNPNGPPLDEAIPLLVSGRLVRPGLHVRRLNAPRRRRTQGLPERIPPSVAPARKPLPHRLRR